MVKSYVAITELEYTTQKVVSFNTLMRSNHIFNERRHVAEKYDISRCFDSVGDEPADGSLERLAEVIKKD